MATYFGEVLPVLSRAVDDDDESEFVNNSQLDEREVIIRWDPEIRKEISASNTSQFSCHYLIVAVGSIPCGFVRQYVLSQQTTCKPNGVISCGLESSDRNSPSQLMQDDTTCFLYKLTSNDGITIVCLWNLRCTPFQNFRAIHQLFDNLSVEREVIIVSSSHVSDYKGRDVDPREVAFLKCLTTDAKSETVLVPKLEVPNIVTGLPAAVLSHCQVYEIAATLYVCYSEDTKQDSTNIGILSPVLLACPFHNLHKDCEHLPEKHTIPLSGCRERNLYI